MIIASGIKCVVKFKYPNYADSEIICDFVDIGKCIRAFRDNCDMKSDEDFLNMSIIVSFKPCYR